MPKKLDFPDKYESGRVESGWYEWWKTSGLFKESSISAPDVDKRFTMILPPPNVTGTLHLGHALTVAVQVRLWFGAYCCMLIELSMFCYNVFFVYPGHVGALAENARFPNPVGSWV